MLSAGAAAAVPSEETDMVTRVLAIARHRGAVPRVLVVLEHLPGEVARWYVVD